MRKFIARIQGCGIIADSDVEFGQVLSPCTTVNANSLLSDRLNDVNLDHLEFWMNNSVKSCSNVSATWRVINAIFYQYTKIMQQKPPRFSSRSHHPSGKLQ